jgi:NAD(P)-dependent dehydrogenase (short-subunit alcohol dehydrogenase family)
MNISQKIALVTGASRGIGAATAIVLAKAGHHCILTARTVGGLEEVYDAITNAGGTATICPLDLRQHTMIDSLGAEIFSRFGRLDIFVGNAAMFSGLSPIAHTSPQEMEDSFSVNVLANFRLLRILDPLLRAAPNGRVVMVTSSAAKNSTPFWGAYGASKAALEHMALTYAAEVAHTNVRVNLFDPGATRTRMRAKAFPSENAEALPAPESVALKLLPLCLEDAPNATRVRA